MRVLTFLNVGFGVGAKKSKISLVWISEAWYWDVSSPFCGAIWVRPGVGEM